MRLSEGQTSLPQHLLGDQKTLEAVARQNASAVYLGGQTVLCRLLGKYLVYADVQDIGITPHLAMAGYWESWVTSVLARTLRPGWHCVDVGANHGYYTLIMADAVGPTGQVAAVEPTPRLVELLHKTFDVNGFPSVMLVEQAASATDGETVHLLIPALRSLNARLSEDAGPGDTVVDVESVTIDALTADWPRVDLIKIDVEGEEERVWEGMQRTIAANPNLVVLLELNVGRYQDPLGFVSKIERAGFTLRYIDMYAAIREVTAAELLERQVGEDWMLYLERR